MDAEHVFKALADHHRRHLLDLLSQQGGQSLTELCAHMPMTRIGVMKHLRILERAGLITTRKVGRERLHYLNPSPMQDLADWAGQYIRQRDERMDRLEEFLREAQQKEPSEAQGNDQDNDQGNDQDNP